MTFIWVPWAYQLPCLTMVAGSRAPPPLRGRATGLLSAGVSCGFALCPLASGPLFQSNLVRVQHKFGAFSHLMFFIAGVFALVEFGVLLALVGTGKKPRS